MRSGASGARARDLVTPGVSGGKAAGESRFVGEKKAPICWVRKETDSSQIPGGDQGVPDGFGATVGKKPMPKSRTMETGYRIPGWWSPALAGKLVS